MNEQARTPGPLKMRLYVMMFLQYFVQGCYLPIISVYLKDALHFTPGQIGYFGSAIAVGPLVAPFIIGQLIDRHVATQRVLAVCHLTGGAVMLGIYMQTAVWPVLILGTAYSVLYVPSLMLTNSLTFHHLVDRDREFPLIRVWGTIGFVVPFWIIEPVLLKGLEGDALHQGRAIALAVAGVAGLVMGLYSMTLPDTPPPDKAARDFAPGKVLGLLRFRNFLVLVLVTLGVAIVHKFFFVVNSPFLRAVLESGGVKGAWEGRISSLGQISEIAVMAGLGMMIVRLGFKGTMLLGLAAYMVRCLVFAAAWRMQTPFGAVMTMVCLGQALHGFCFGCFMAAAFMYVDRFSPKDVRGSMQNVYGTFVIGLGFFAGGFIAGGIGDWFTVGSGPAAKQNWIGIWLASAAIAALCLAAFAAAFPRAVPQQAPAEPTAPPATPMED